MANNNGLKLIAIGLAKSTKDRQANVDRQNDLIDSLADAIRSSSNTDGQPGGVGGTSDPIGAKAIKIESIERGRDMEQERLNAVAWAEKSVRDLFKEEDGDGLIEAIYAYLDNRRQDAVAIIENQTSLTISNFHYAKKKFLTQILLYLNLLMR